MLFLTIVHPFCGGGTSGFAVYEPGCETWVYENASVDEELFKFGLGTGFGAVLLLLAALGLLKLDERFQLGLLGDSESEPLSQASSSAQSGMTYDENLCDGFKPM